MEQQTSSQARSGFIHAVHGFRYQVEDVARAVAFYTQRLGFTLKHSLDDEVVRAEFKL